MIGSQWWLPSDIVWKLGTQFRLWRLRLWSNYDWLLLLQVRAKNCRWVPPSLPHMSCCPRLSVLFYKPAHGCPSARSWMAPVLLHVLLRCHSARSWIVPRRHLSARSWIVACGNTREHTMIKDVWIPHTLPRFLRLGWLFSVFFSVTSTTRITNGQSVSAIHVLLSVLFYEWARGCHSARVASCLVEVSFCGVVNSALQASFREVVDSAFGNAWILHTMFKSFADHFLIFAGNFHNKPSATSKSWGFLLIAGWRSWPWIKRIVPPQQSLRSGKRRSQVLLMTQYLPLHRRRRLASSCR